MKFEDMEMGYKESLGNSLRVRILSPVEETPMAVVNNNNNDNIFKECLKNHAVSHGGHSLDGCCEFLPVEAEGSLDALKCAVCNYHRNFHHKEAPLPSNVVSIGAIVPATVIPAGDAYPSYNHHCHHAPPLPQYAVYPSAIALISASGGGGGGEDHDDVMDIDNGGGSSSNSKKKFRTKFTPEQKEKMLAFARRMDWRIRKQDDNVVQEFCNENGVKHRVLEVWMNNKFTLDQDLLMLDVVMYAMKFEAGEFGG